MKIYQIATDPNSLMQSYVIKTKKNKIIVIDGGIDGAGRDAPVFMPSAIRAILGLGQDDYFEIEAWFLSHEHSDHFYELAKMLCSYDGGYKIKNFYFDFPDYSVVPCTEKIEDKYFQTLVNGLEKYGNACNNGVSFYSLNGSVINSETVEKGVAFDIDGIRIEVLQTWSKDLREDINNDALVLRVLEGEKSVLFLNDLGVKSGKRLLKKYGDRLKSTVVQMAHHGQNGVGEEIYKAVDAKIRLWPIPIWVWQRVDLFATGQTRSWLNGGEDYTLPKKEDFVACFYPKYPTDVTLVSAWNEVIEAMAIEI